MISYAGVPKPSLERDYWRRRAIFALRGQRHLPNRSCINLNAASISRIQTHWIASNRKFPEDRAV